MKASASRVFELISSGFGRSSAPTLLHDEVARVLLIDGQSESMNEALEVAEPLLAEVSQLVEKYRTDAERLGVDFHFELYGSDYEWIRGTSFDDKSLNLETQNVRRRRLHLESVKSELINLHFTEFEQACTTILEILGCEDYWTSPPRNDGGIDFYGRLNLKGRLDQIFPLGGVDGSVKVWLVGQAKHYPKNAIQTSAVRELVGSIELRRTGGAVHEWPGLENRPFDPVVILFFTTGKFSSGSINLLKRSGIVSMNGEQLATLLCDSGVGFDDSDVFHADKFRSRLLDIGG